MLTFLVFGTISCHPHLICQILKHGYEVYLHHPNISCLTDGGSKENYLARSSCHLKIQVMLTPDIPRLTRPNIPCSLVSIWCKNSSKA